MYCKDIEIRKLESEVSDQFLYSICLNAMHKFD